jgi:hypothetical protein
MMCSSDAMTAFHFRRSLQINCLSSRAYRPSSVRTWSQNASALASPLAWISTGDCVAERQAECLAMDANGVAGNHFVLRAGQFSTVLSCAPIVPDLLFSRQSHRGAVLAGRQKHC